MHQTLELKVEQKFILLKQNKNTLLIWNNFFQIEP